jgi:hypothetical protein
MTRFHFPAAPLEAFGPACVAHPRSRVALAAVPIPAARDLRGNGRKARVEVR